MAITKLVRSDRRFSHVRGFGMGQEFRGRRSRKVVAIIGDAPLRRTSKKRKLASLLAEPLDNGFKDIRINVDGVDTDGTGGLLNGIVRGTSSTTRKSNRLRLVSLMVRGSIYAESANVTANKVGLAVIYDKRPTGSLPS